MGSFGTMFQNLIKISPRKCQKFQKTLRLFAIVPKFLQKLSNSDFRQKWVAFFGIF